MTMLSSPVRKRIFAASTGWVVATSGLLAGAAAWVIMPERYPRTSRWREVRIVLQGLLGLAAWDYAVRLFLREREDDDAHGIASPPPNER
jgi:hypothetical protein